MNKINKCEKTFLSIAVAALVLGGIACGTKNHEQGSQTKSLRETTVIVNNNDGTFTATCKNGTSERVTLAQLSSAPNSICGGSATIMCKANGYAGSTIEGAIQACVNAGYSAGVCGSNVSCTGDAPMCKANGYAGSSIESAIDACTTAGYSAGVCGSNVSCTGNAPMCKADGYAGSSIEGAIQACRNAGYSAGVCGSNVSCSGNMAMCKANGYAGSTIENAIRACQDAGYSAGVCGSNASCK